MRKFLFLPFTAFAALLVLSCSGDSDMPCITCDGSKQPEPEYKGGSCKIEDYAPEKIGEQVWLTKNWGCYAPGSKCYDNKSANCQKYGRLYDWVAADTVCPSGWHLPSKEEWGALIGFVENDNKCSHCAAKHLKSEDDWNDDGNGLDTHKFSALPGGSYSDELFLGAGYYGAWWSVDEFDSDKAYNQKMNVSDETLLETKDKSFLFSVRCLKDLQD